MDDEVIDYEESVSFGIIRTISKRTRELEIFTCNDINDQRDERVHKMPKILDKNRSPHDET